MTLVVLPRFRRNNPRAAAMGPERSRVPGERHPSPLQTFASRLGSAPKRGPSASAGVPRPAVGPRPTSGAPGIDAGGHDHPIPLALLCPEIEELDVKEGVVDKDDQEVAANHARARLVREGELLRDGGVLVNPGPPGRDRTGACPSGRQTRSQCRTRDRDSGRRATRSCCRGYSVPSAASGSMNTSRGSPGSRIIAS